ncbi:hypothetical protein [Canibacter zhoujuaniae]|uniref:hypothetical protein n=1 Tax=Canibacter zhoujuaniae TaxID=2708343 RepID=UPI00141D8FD2|nr:hypothetical protein [Canibacter zhoujuaniae]
MRKRALVWVFGLSLLILIIALSFVVVPILTHQNQGVAGQVRAHLGDTAVTAKGDDGRERTLALAGVDDDSFDPANLVPGQTVTVRGAGYDSARGIYVSFCKAPASPEQKPSPCLGEVPASADAAAAVQGEMLSSAWVSDDFVWRNFATHQYLDAEAGTFTVKLVVPEAAIEGLDCRVEACVLATRNDHTAGGDRVQDLVIPVVIH